MTGVKTIGLGAALLVAGAGFAGAASAAPMPVGTLCNDSGKIEVMAQISGTACTAEPDKELKALLKARQAYRDEYLLSAEQKAQIDARIDRRLHELWKAKAEVEK